MKKEETFEQRQKRINAFVPKELTVRERNNIEFKWSVKVKANKNRTKDYYELVSLSNLDTKHLANILKVINNTKGDTFAYRPKSAWINAVNLELSYRDKLGDEALKHLPKLKKSISKTVFIDGKTR